MFQRVSGSFKSERFTMLPGCCRDVPWDVRRLHGVSGSFGMFQGHSRDALGIPGSCPGYSRSFQSVSVQGFLKKILEVSGFPRYKGVR